MMDLTAALFAAVGGLASTIAVLGGVIRYMYLRDAKRQQTGDAKIEAIRKAMELRMESSEAHCRKELAESRADISRLNEDVSRLAMRDRDMAVSAILLYAEKRDADRDLLERIAYELEITIPPTDPSRRTTVKLRAITEGTHQ